MVRMWFESLRGLTSVETIVTMLTGMTSVWLARVSVSSLTLQQGAVSCPRRWWQQKAMKLDKPEL